MLDEDIYKKETRKEEQMFNFEQLELVELLDLTFFLFGTSEAISKILKPEITKACAVEARIKLHVVVEGHNVFC